MTAHEGKTISSKQEYEKDKKSQEEREETTSMNGLRFTKDHPNELGIGSPCLCIRTHSSLGEFYATC